MPWGHPLRFATQLRAPLPCPAHDAGRPDNLCALVSPSVRWVEEITECAEELCHLVVTVSLSVSQPPGSTTPEPGFGDTQSTPGTPRGSGWRAHPSGGGHGPAALRPGPGWVWRTQRGPFSYQASLWDSLSAPRATTRPLFWVRRRQAVAWGVLLRPGGAPVPSLWGEAVSGGRLGFLGQFPGRPGHHPLLYPAGQQLRFSPACAGVLPQSWMPRLGDTKWAVMRGVDWHFREDAAGGGCPGKDVGAFLGVATPK